MASFVNEVLSSAGKSTTMIFADIWNVLIHLQIAWWKISAIFVGIGLINCYNDCSYDVHWISTCSL